MNLNHSLNIKYYMNGVLKRTIADANPTAPMIVDFSINGSGKKISNLKIANPSYTADVVQQTDYYPYGMVMPNRNGSDNSYRYGFQGQEKDDEVKGAGESINYKYRMHDPRIGRFFAVDPLTKSYPQWSPYQFSGNQVIATVELEGLEPSDDLNIQLNEENYKKGETYQGSDKSAKNQQNIFNWTIEKTGDSQYRWKPGSQYYGPNIGESVTLAENVYDIFKGYQIKGSVPNSEYDLIGSYSFVGFTMGIYQRVIDGVKFNAVVFAGSNQGIDWLSNFGQGLGSKDYQYETAALVGDKLKNEQNLTFIGHSLGGGLASLAALKSNARAITFNAPGLSYATQAYHKVLDKSAKKINAFVVQVEAVNSSLGKIGQGAIGNVHYLPAIGSSNPVTLHGMSSVRKSFGL